MSEAWEAALTTMLANNLTLRTAAHNSPFTGTTIICEHKHVAGLLAMPQIAVLPDELLLLLVSRREMALRDAHCVCMGYAFAQGKRVVLAPLPLGKHVISTSERLRCRGAVVTEPARVRKALNSGGALDGQ